MSFVAALTFLTILPWPAPVGANHFKAAPAFFPLVGLLIGVAIAGLDAGLRLVLPASVTSALVLVALLAITGGLHVDGLADTCDGIFMTGATRERRLEVMRDSRVGGYGVAGLVCVLLVQYAALAAIPAPLRPFTLLFMGMLSRWAMGLAILLFPYGRPQGLGSAFQPQGRKVLQFLLPAFFVLALCHLGGHLLGLLLFAGTVVTCWITGAAMVRRLGGLTGDSYGAICEVVQGAVLVLVLAFR